MMNKYCGILPLMKPIGLTSHDCVAKVRRLLHMKRVGHTGTLDPSVSGVLPICVGQATRMVEYIQEMPKTYDVRMILGKSTDTEDADGEVCDVKPVVLQLTPQQIEECLHRFTGKIEQIPPMYSAVKVNGVRLHKLARQGQVIERASREIEIYHIELKELVLEQPFPEIAFSVRCSKGTYVRTLCVDIGKKLGYPAYMGYLQRTASGPFVLEDCITFEEIEQACEMGNAEQILQPIDIALSHFPKIVVNNEQAKDIFNGKRIKFDHVFDQGQLVRVYGPFSTFLAIYRVDQENGVVMGRPEKVFHGEGERDE